MEIAQGSTVTPNYNDNNISQQLVKNDFPKESPSQKVETHYGKSTVTVTVDLDPESFEILQKASEIYSDTIINAGIKLFSKTTIYKEIMSTHKDQQEKEEDLNEIVSIKEAVKQTDNKSSNSNTTNNEVKSVPKPKSGGFSAW